MSDLFKTFNIEGFSVPEAKKDEKKGTGSTGSSTPKASSNKDSDSDDKKSSSTNKGAYQSKLSETVIEKFPITVCYARAQDVYTRDDFEKEGDITLEDLRIKLSLDYPEFDHNEVKMEYDKKKCRIVPNPTGRKLGSVPTIINSHEILMRFLVEGVDGVKYGLNDVYEKMQMHVPEFSLPNGELSYAKLLEAFALHDDYLPPFHYPNDPESSLTEAEYFDILARAYYHIHARDESMIALYDRLGFN